MRAWNSESGQFEEYPDDLPTFRLVPDAEQKLADLQQKIAHERQVRTQGMRVGALLALYIVLVAVFMDAGNDAAALLIPPAVVVLVAVLWVLWVRP